MKRKLLGLLLAMPLLTCCSGNGSNMRECCMREETHCNGTLTWKEVESDPNKYIFVRDFDVTINGELHHHKLIFIR